MNPILLLLISLFYTNPKPVETIDLTVTITNINTIKGNIEMGVFTEAKTFLVAGKEYKTYSKKVTNNSLVFTLTGLPKNNYALSIYHDENADKKCNLNFLGIPKEAYGFSNNFKPKLSKPTFEDCKVNAQKDMSISIKLID